MVKFEVGKTYSKDFKYTSIAPKIKCVGRTEKTAIFDNFGEKKRCKIRLIDGIECVFPDFCSVISAGE